MTPNHLRAIERSVFGISLETLLSAIFESAIKSASADPQSGIDRGTFSQFPLPLPRLTTVLNVAAAFCSGSAFAFPE